MVELRPCIINNCHGYVSFWDVGFWDEVTGEYFRLEQLDHRSRCRECSGLLLERGESPSPDWCYVPINGNGMSYCQNCVELIGEEE